LRLPYENLETGAGRIGYYTLGNGRPLLMLHAAGTGAASLLKLATMLATRRRVFVPDLTGYGNTVLVGGSVIERHRAVVDAILKLIGTPADVFGHSMGGALAVMKAIGEATAVRRLVLVEPILFSAIDFTVPQHAAARKHDERVAHELVTAIRAGDPDRGLSAFFADWNDVPFHVLPPDTQGRLRVMAPHIADEVETLAKSQPPRDAYRAVRQPTLLMAGAKAPPTAHAINAGLASLLASAQSHTIAGAGHMGPVARPPAFAPAIDAFLAE